LEDRLRSLYKLQLIDDQLDELESLRGDLPATVRDLELKISQLRSGYDAKKEEKVESTTKRETNVTDMETLLENQKNYKARLYSVRNNKEYDSLTKAIDQVDEEIRKKETENEALVEKEAKLQEEIESVEPLLNELETELSEKEADLKTIVKSNEREENKIRQERAVIEAKIKKPDIAKYLQIRKAKSGKAVVTIRRNACAGCHNVIPSQRQLDIRKKDRIYTCDSCGRIIVPSDVADSVNQ
jgi:uncharacterized protein